MSTTTLYATRFSVEEGGVTKHKLAISEARHEIEQLSELYEPRQGQPQLQANASASAFSPVKSNTNSTMAYMSPLMRNKVKQQQQQHYDAMSPELLPSSPMQSPVTVALAPFWKSTISVGDTGAEVTLDHSQNSNHSKDDEDGLLKKIEAVLTPNKSKSKPMKRLDYDPSMRAHLADNSLLDPQLVPESPETPMKVTPFCGMYGCFPTLTSSTKSDLRLNDSISTHNTRRNSSVSSFQLHGCILTSLGSCEDGDSWQRMLPSDFDDVVHEENEENTFPSPHHVRVMHNRTLHGRNKSARLKKLKRDLHPFGRSNSTDRMVLRVSTFSTPRSKREKGVRAVEYLETPVKPGWQWNCNPTYDESPSHHPPASRHLAEVDANACYDSDPEDYQIRQSFSGLSLNGQSKVPRPCVNENDECSMKDLVQASFKQRWTLIFHPQRGTPVGVEAWLERGQRLAKATLPPKLVWLPLCEKSSKRANLQDSEKFTAVDLLDIQRILETTQINRDKFPFAKPRRTFCIKSLSGDYCLEARSMADRDQFVRQLKLTVARFGSQLVSGDPGVEDFFVPISHGHPASPIV